MEIEFGYYLTRGGQLALVNNRRTKLDMPIAHQWPFEGVIYTEDLEERMTWTVTGRELDNDDKTEWDLVEFIPIEDRPELYI